MCSTMEAFSRKHLEEMGWCRSCTLLNDPCPAMQDANQLAYEAAMCQATQRFVTKRTRGELSVSVLQPADTFLEVVVLPFLCIVLGKELVGCCLISGACFGWLELHFCGEARREVGWPMQKWGKVEACTTFGEVCSHALC
jgi:hypothetical protein